MRRVRQYKRNILVILVSVLILIPGTFQHVNAQNVDKLESDLTKAKNELTAANTKLMLLKNRFSERTEMIDKAKKDGNKTEEEIIEIMASSVTISNDIKVQEKRVKTLEQKVGGIKNELNKRYTEIIDSLKIVKSNSGTEKGKNRIDNQIVFYTEKKLVVSPVMAALSLEPEKLIAIDPVLLNDPIQKRIVNEYLQGALKEVDSYMSMIEEENEEISEITMLQKKTQQFLEETEFGSDTKPMTVVSQTVRASSNTEVSFDGGGKDEQYRSGTNPIVLPQLESYSKIMDQLSFIGHVSQKNWQTTLTSAKENLSLNEYKLFLDELEERLGEYKLILQNKAAGINE